MIRRIWLLLAVLTAFGCKQPRISMEPGSRTFTPESYPSVWEAWTRSEESFSWRELSHEIFVSATFESWEFRWAYVVRYAHDFSLEPEARDEMLQASLESSRQEHRFFVTLAGMDFRESNLAGRESAWRVLLVDPEGNQTVPVRMEQVRRPSAVDRVYFPQVDPFRQTFRLTFPAVDANGRRTIPEDADFVVLRFTGARGRADLRWALQPIGGG
ncbi:MAG: hypothetical protein OEV36_12535 [Myxococcales bacterium]|nr:hypothetical protein [Myxococcales bacterium]